VGWGREIAKSVVAVLGCAGLFAASPAAAAGPPLIEASWVTGVTATGATMRAQITANGLETKYHFEYIPQAAYEANLVATPPREGFFGAAASSEEAVSAGATAQKVFKIVQGLKPLTAYRYRAVATNSADTTPGPEHTLTTQPTTLVFGLPDDRGWEMVSPIDKGGGAVGAPQALFGGGDFQAAAHGEGEVTWGSVTAFGDAAGAPPVSQYVSRRTGSGWATENVSAPLESGGYGDKPDGAPYRVFSEDLSRGLMLDGSRCAVEGTCSPTYSLWQGGTFQGLPTLPGLSFAGASPDLQHAVFEADSGLYEWGGGALVQMSAGAGAALAAPIGAVFRNGFVYFTELEDGPLRLYEEGGATKTLPNTVGTGASFQVASADGSIAYYTAGSALYRYEADAGTGESIATGVSGVLGASPDGSRIYFQDGAGLELWRAGTTTLVAEGPDAAEASDFPPATGTARIGEDGSLAFLSKAELTGYDNADAGSGEPDSELYLFRPANGGATAELTCVSCNPTGERPEGPTTIPGAPANGSSRAYKPRSFSADGNRLVFDSADRLFALDTNKQPDVYQWEASGEGDCTRAPGCVSLLSDGRDPGGASLVDASADGTDVYFLTNASLIETDPGSIDLYDARVGGGFPEPEKPFVCNGDACQILPAEPEDPTPGTLTPNPGNPARHFSKEKPRRHPKRRHRNRRHHRGRRTVRHGGERHR
jgi:hypothetical protein